MNPSPSQHTLAGELLIDGVGLHGGRPVRLVLRPAPPDTGIRARRTDLPDAPAFPVDVDHIVDSARASTVGNGDGATLATVEHLLAALVACGVDNCEIAVDGPELPAMDGSAAPYVEALRDCGTAAQPAPRRVLRVTRPVTVDDGARTATLHPADRLVLDVTIDYGDGPIGRQRHVFDAAEAALAETVCPARTFCLAGEIDALHARGLGLGGSLANTLVVAEDGPLNPGGLRFPDEYARHKALDLAGDLYLLGAPLAARCEAVRPGHALTHALMRAARAAPGVLVAGTAAEQGYTNG